MDKENYSKILRKKYVYNLVAVIMFIILFGAAIIAEYTICSSSFDRAVNVKKTSDLVKYSDTNKYVKLNLKKIYDLSIEMDKQKLYAVIFNQKIVVIKINKGDDAKVTEHKDGVYSITGVVGKYSNHDLKNLKTVLKGKGFTDIQLDSALCNQYLKIVSPYRNLYIIVPIEIIILIILLLRPIGYLITNKKVMLSTRIYSKGNIKGIYADVEMELSNPDKIENGPVTMTKNYIIVNSKRIVFALPIKELIWIFETNKRDFLNSKLVFIFSTGKQYKVPIDKQYIDYTEDIIKHISKVSPTTFTGNSEEHYELYRKHPREFMEYWQRRAKEEKTKSVNN